MSVRELSGRFVGLRVQRKIGDKTKLKHYSFKIPVANASVASWRAANAKEKAAIVKKANELDQQWALEQAAAKPVKKFNPFDGETNTGCKGIGYRWSKDRQNYDVEAFHINVVDNEGVQKSESVRLKRRSWREGWEIAVAKLAKIKHLDTATVNKILKRMPKESTLRIYK